MLCNASAKVLPCWWVWSTDESMQVAIITLAGCLNTSERRAGMANWACVRYKVSLFTVMMCSVRSEACYFYLCAFFFGGGGFNHYQYQYTGAVNSNNKRPMDVRASWIWSLSWWCSSFTDNDLVNWDSLPLHSESPGYWRRVFLNCWVCHGEVILMWFCELFMEGGDGIFPDSWWFSWPETRDVGGGIWLCFLLNTTFTPSCFLSLCLSPLFFLVTLSLTLQFSLSNTERCTPCLCADGCCLVARSPSRSSDIVVVCLYWLECVTCICQGSLEGVCFCSQCCKQGGAPFPNHSVGEGYFHRSFLFSFFFFLFIITLNRLAWDGIMCWSRQCG